MGWFDTIKKWLTPKPKPKPTPAPPLSSAPEYKEPPASAYKGTPLSKAPEYKPPGQADQGQQSGYWQAQPAPAADSSYWKGGGGGGGGSSYQAPQQQGFSSAFTPEPYTPSPPTPTYQAGGWGNVGAVMAAAVNPFSETSIVANTDSRIFNTVAEYVANSPYAAALMITGGATLAKAGWSAAKGAATKGTGLLPTVFDNVVSKGVTTNTVTAKQSVGLLAKIAAQMKKPVFVISAIGAMIGTYPWAEWALGEAKEGMIFNTGKAIATGDPQVMQDYMSASNDIFDINIWENIGRLIPGANIAVGFSNKAKALGAQKKVNDKILQDEIQQITTGETDEERWARVREEQAAQEKALIDYYNQERKKMVKWENEARAAAAAAQSAADKKARKEDAAFWAAERAKQRKLEEEDRKAIADFWIQYRKTMLKIADDSRPSTLKFGLL